MANQYKTDKGMIVDETKALVSDPKKRAALTRISTITKHDIKYLVELMKEYDLDLKTLNEFAYLNKTYGTSLNSLCKVRNKLIKDNYDPEFVHMDIGALVFVRNSVQEDTDMKISYGSIKVFNDAFLGGAYIQEDSLLNGLEMLMYSFRRRRDNGFGLDYKINVAIGLSKELNSNDLNQICDKIEKGEGHYSRALTDNLEPLLAEERVEEFKKVFLKGNKKSKNALNKGLNSLIYSFLKREDSASSLVDKIDFAIKLSKKLGSNDLNQICYKIAARNNRKRTENVKEEEVEIVEKLPEDEAGLPVTKEQDNDKDKDEDKEDSE